MTPYLECNLDHNYLSEGRRNDAVSGEEAMFWRVQVPEVQAKMDEWEQLGQHGTGRYLN